MSQDGNANLLEQMGIRFPLRGEKTARHVHPPKKAQQSDCLSPGRCLGTHVIRCLLHVKRLRPERGQDFDSAQTSTLLALGSRKKACAFPCSFIPAACLYIYKELDGEKAMNQTMVFAHVTLFP